MSLKLWRFWRYLQISTITGFTYKTIGRIVRRRPHHQLRTLGTNPLSRGGRGTATNIETAVGAVSATIWRKRQRSNHTILWQSTRFTVTCDTTGHLETKSAGSSMWSRMSPVVKFIQVAPSPRWLGLRNTVPHATTHRNRNMVGRGCATTSD